MKTSEDQNLLDSISALLARSRERDDPSLAEIEHTLTSGYARAHALEAEQLRLDRKIVEVAGLLAAEGAERHGRTLHDLSQRRSRAERELARLRRLLAPLRDLRALRSGQRARPSGGGRSS